MNTVWSIWAVSFVLAIARGHERAITLAGLPWWHWTVTAFMLAIAGKHESISILATLPRWHRAMGAAAAVAFFAGYLGRLIGHQ
jgi:hypothetical protein